MAITYTSNAGLQKPGTADRNWDLPINANADALDALTAIGGLATVPAELPSTSLRVRVSAGRFVRADGTIGTFAGSAAYTVPASATTCLWLADDGSLGSGLAFPTTAHVRLARIESGATSIARVVDERVQCAVAGTGLGFVLKSGDTVSGPFSVVAPGAGSNVLVVDAAGRAIGFFGATPQPQSPSNARLVDGTGGAAGGTVANVGVSFSQAQLNANFASLAAKVNALIDALKRHGLMA